VRTKEVGLTKKDSKFSIRCKSALAPLVVLLERVIEWHGKNMLQNDAWLDEKPYKEVYDGQVHPKVSPQRKHSLVQGAIVALILDWGRERGDTGTEWRVYLDENTSLVPDVSFISDERLAGLSEAQLEKPPFAPELTVEIRSPENREREIRRKTELYLQHGALVVLDVDPMTRLVCATTRDGETILKAGDAFTHLAFPDLSLPVDAIFAPLDRRR
jgi:Uma2 family endonuclease